jgi:hypothetical protein
MIRVHNTSRRHVAKPAAILTVLLAVAATLANPARGNDTDVLIDKALSLSGIASQLEALTTAVFMAVPGDVFPDTKTREAADTAFKKSLTRETLIAPIREALRDAYSRDSLEKVVEFYESKTGRKVARLQSRGLSPDLLRTIREGRKTALSMEEPRSNLLRRLIRAENIAGTNSSLVASLVNGLLQGVQQEDRKPFTLENPEAAKGEIKPDGSRAEELALVGMAHTFRSLDDKELEELANFHESEAGVWFRQTVLKGLHEAVSRVGVALGEALQKRRNP